MAQEIGGTGLGTNWYAGTARPCYQIEAQWDGENWTDETARCHRWETSAVLYDRTTGLPMMGWGQPATATLRMDNSDNHLSPGNGSSPIHADIADGIYRVPIRISAGYVDAVNGAERLRQFTGEIEAATEQETTNSREVTLHCLDDSISLLEYNETTTLHTEERADQFIDTLLAGAGIASRALDKGMSQVPYLWLNDDNLMKELSRLAQSEAGMIHFSKEAQFRFWRMTALLERAHSKAPQATITTGRAWLLTDQNSWKDAYSTVTVVATPRRVYPVDYVYESSEQIELPPSGSETVSVQFRWPVSEMITPVAGVDYEAMSWAGQDMAANISVGVTAHAQQAVLTFTNNNPNHAIWIVNLRVRGKPLVGEESEDVEFASDIEPPKVPGTKVYQLRGNPFIQTRAQLERLGGFLRDRLQRPRRLWGWTGPAIPFLELGDRVTLQNAAAGIDGDAYVVGIKQTGQAEGMYEMNLELLPVAGLYAHDAYFVLGVSSYADSGADPLFY